MAPINRLARLTTGEVSLVKRGANRKTYALTKSGDTVMSFKPNSNLMLSVMKTAVEGEDDLVAKLQKSGVTDEAALNAAVANFRIAKSFSDKLTDAQFATVSKAAGYAAKADDEDEEETEKGEDDEDEKDDAPPADLKGKKAKKKAKKGEDEPFEKDEEDDEEKTKMSKTKKSAPLDPQLEAVMKSNKDLVAMVSKLVDERDTLTFTKKAATEFSHVPGTDDEIGAVLKSAYAVSEKHGKQIEATLARVNKALEASNLTGATGSRGAFDGDAPASAWGEILKRAEEMVQKSVGSDKPMSREKAIDLVQKSDPTLYARYLEEHPRQMGER